MTDRQKIAELRRQRMTEYAIKSYMRGWRAVGDRYGKNGQDLI